ncbi:MAG: protease [Acetobacteraceae bacterium]|nr:protease [Acetobacteraceae bacterium]
MIRLVLLLLGASRLRDRWPFLLGFGLLGITLALAIIADAVDGVTVVATRTFGWILLIDGLAALAAGLVGRNRTSRFDMVRALCLIVLGLLILDFPWKNDLANSLLFGLAFLIDGAARVVTAAVLRFRGWALVVAGGAVELGLATLAFASWPVPYQKTVPFCIGVLLLLSAWTVLRFALALRRLPPDGSIFSLPGFGRRCWHGAVAASAPARAGGRNPPLVLHVWTPRGSAEDVVRRPLVDRWIAAVDGKGRISTGHAALELAPDLYISHYPAIEIDRSPADLIRALRATADNDMPGRFLPSYREEAEGWVEADAHVVFERFNAARLRAHWAEYSKDATYNLTRRNCSVSAALALEAALEGVLAEGPLWHRITSLLGNPDLWLAAAVRHRAETMTWTPGLVLDYARALQRVVKPPPIARRVRLRDSIRRILRARAALRANGSLGPLSA